MDPALFNELIRQAPGIGAILLLVHTFLKFIGEERKSRDEKDAHTMAAIERMESACDLRAKECHKTQAESTVALHRVAGVIERLPKQMKDQQNGT